MATDAPTLVISEIGNNHQGDVALAKQLVDLSAEAGAAGTTAHRFCDPPANYLATSTDCDDTDPARSPSAIEVCDPLNTDEDCDGLVDDVDPSATGQVPFFADGDGGRW